MKQVLKNDTSNLPVIGISGKIGSGKDIFAERFALKSPILVQKHAFADKVREIIELLTGEKMTRVYEKNKPFFNEVYSYTQEQKNIYLSAWNKTIGECLQLIGTDLFRDHFDPDTWVKTLFETIIPEVKSLNQIPLITDVRFPNEADEILSRGGIVVRLFGDPVDIRKNSKRDLNHISETALDNYDKFTYVFESINFKILDENIKKVIKDLVV
jgi:hypothetical protein